MTYPTRELARSLPKLRRYAHALTGSPQRGDQYVRACLEVIVCEPSSVQRANDPKFALFKLFHEIMRVTDSVTRREVRAAHVDGASRSSETKRRLQLLVAMCGFSEERASELISAARPYRRSPASSSFAMVGHPSHPPLSIPARHHTGHA
ncbi:MAG TPA: hypothetical protein VKY65_17130 [Alphaproteobacteria bacterium]|nr:hypothetical protein [Alphaproteobacteria bacterium]